MPLWQMDLLVALTSQVGLVTLVVSGLQRLKLRMEESHMNRRKSRESGKDGSQGKKRREHGICETN